MKPILDVQHLQVSFRTQNGNVHAVRDISFKLNKGETLSIVGESGSGKSVTSKSIMGILAGNSIIEGGKILYDGKDLLTLPEEDFTKIRGDKISMIFQDPLSALDPIVKVGKQMTLAMRIKAKRSQKGAKKAVDDKLNNLNYYLNLAFPGEEEKNALDCEFFKEFIINATKIELKYKRAKEMTHILIEELTKYEEILAFGKSIELAKMQSTLSRLIKKCFDRYGLQKEDTTLNLVKALQAEKNSSGDVLLDNIRALLKKLNESQEATEPDFFCIGYLNFVMPDRPEIPSIEEANKFARKVIEETFMNDFIERIKKAYEYQGQEVYLNQKKLVERIKRVIYTIENRSVLDETEMIEFGKGISLQVRDTIKCLNTYKNSTEYTFRSAYENAVEQYFAGVKKNPKNIAKHERKQKSYDRLVAKGKKPTWEVVPPALVDLELQKQNILDILKSLMDNYIEQIEVYPEYDAFADADNLISFFIKEASLMVDYLSLRMAKERAIRLLNEVGIPHPEMTFEQYPFNLSGGMRQRIVIAIALSANPEILICDEPTTALDVTIQAQILELINKLKKERQLSVIFITHDLGVVANIADKVAVMYAGKIVEIGTVRDIFYDPRHPYTWALLSSMPDLDTKETLEAIPGTPPNMIYPPKGDAFAERNKYAMEIDFLVEPPLFEIEGEHCAATWLLHPNAPKVEMPKSIVDRINRMRSRLENGKE